MKGLKQIRLVYRQHLLPPMVIPYQRILQYRKIFQNSEDKLEERQSQQQLERIIELHQTVITQLLKIKKSYISPLKKCPFYYEFLDNRIRKGLFMGQFEHTNYLQAISSLSLTERLKIHQNTYNQYIVFKKKLEENDATFYQHVKLIPIFKYESPQQLALASRKDWGGLRELEKIKIREKYAEKLEKHWKQLNKIALSSSISIDELLQLIKNQINPPLSLGLKNLLFA